MRTEKDSLFRFILEGSDVRGELVRLDRSWRTLVQRHAYPPPVRRVLGEAVSAVALLTATIKFDGKLSIQARGDGALRFLMAEATADGTVRGLARWRGPVPHAPLSELLGNGRLVITIEPGRGRDRYQGIVDCSADTLADALRDYFGRSEQLPTRLWLAVDDDRAAGLLLQKVPGDGREEWVNADETWERSVRLTNRMPEHELLDLDATRLLTRVYGDRRVRLFDARTWEFRCGCSRGKVENMLRVLGRSELETLLAEQGRVEVSCEFCNAEFVFDAVDVEQLLAPGMQPAVSAQTRH